MEWVEMLARLVWGRDIRQRGQLEESHGCLRVGRFILLVLSLGSDGRKENSPFYPTKWGLSLQQLHGMPIGALGGASHS